MPCKNFRQAKAIESSNKKRLLALNKDLNENSGIYFFTREDENGFKYAYIGQAVHILTRLAQHLVGYQHIDLSLKKHGLYSDKNSYGWKVGFKEYKTEELDSMERFWIKKYALSGYQLRNVTSGSQGKGKSKIADGRPVRGYQEGLHNGYIKASKDVSNLFDKHLNYSKKSDKPNKNQDKAVEKFENFLNAYKEVKEDGK